MKRDVGALALLGLLFSAGLAMAGGLVIVTHPDFPVADIRTEELSRIFLGKVNRIGSTQVNPVNKESGSPERALFDQRVHRMDDAQMKEFWLAARIKGEGNPPRSFQSDAAVLRYVASIRGAIGYVGSQPASGPARALKVNGAAPADGGYPLTGP